MKRIKILTGGIAVACVLALAATPALAGEFMTSKAGKTQGVSEEEQLFKFGPIKVKCLKATAKGLVAQGSSSTLATSVKFAKCLTTAKVGGREIFLGTKFLSPLAIEYHANGFVESGSELEEVQGKAVIAGGSAELKVNTGKTEEFTKSECHVSWPAQTLPLKAEKDPEEMFSSATYTNEATPHLVNAAFPDGLQHYIVISSEFKRIHFEFEGEPCETWGKEEGSEGGSGTYTGSFPQKLIGGNLEFQ